MITELSNIVYLEYWGLRERPFENTPDPKFFYSSPVRKQALERLLYTIHSQKGCALLTGEYGCGKTFLMRKTLDLLNGNDYEIALMNYPIFGPNEFLREILFQQGQEVKGGSGLELFHRISAYLYENVSQNRQNLLVIDEAQLIEEPQVFEEIRLLLNLQLEDRFLINIFLVGQPELRERILQHPQLEQRISIRFHLHPFGHEDMVAYIRHRLRIAGAARELFTPTAYNLVFKLSHGVARRINNLCDICLLDGASSGVQVIDEETIKRNV